MRGLFGTNKKSPSELAKQLREYLVALDKAPDKRDKVAEDINRTIAQLKQVCKEAETAKEGSEAVVHVSSEFYSNEANMSYLMVKHMNVLDFDGKKDLAQLYVMVLQRKIGTRYPTVDYLSHQPDVMRALINGYSVPDCGLTCGAILRECTKQEVLASLIINLDAFYELFEYIELPTFDIASDAFTVFKDLLTRHKNMVSQWLEANYDKFFGEYNALLQSNNYVTKRQALRLLGEILLDRHNFSSMTKYISSSDNLKTIMKLLSDKTSRSIQYETFHVFKVFVANPQKPRPIFDILLRNKEKLVTFLVDFQSDRTDDEQFLDEKNYLIKQIGDMNAEAVPPE